MFQKIFFVSLQYVNFVALTAYIVYALLKWFPQRLEKIEKETTLKREILMSQKESLYDRALFGILLFEIPFFAIGIFASLMDKLSDMTYLTAVGTVLLVTLIMGDIALNVYLKQQEKKYHIKRNVTGGTPLLFRMTFAIAFIFSLCLSQVVYVTILLFV